MSEHNMERADDILALRPTVQDFSPAGTGLPLCRGHEYNWGGLAVVFVCVCVKKLILLRSLQHDLIFGFVYITQIIMRTNKVIALHLDLFLSTLRERYIKCHTWLMGFLKEQLYSFVPLWKHLKVLLWTRPAGLDLDSFACTRLILILFN